MKILSIELKCFKRFRDKTLCFTESETGLAKDLIVLLGENGSGKSTILQVIASLLGCATKQLEDPAELDWPGFNLEFADKSWQFPGRVELKVGFLPDEIEAVKGFYTKIPELSSRPDAIQPSGAKVVKLILEQGKVKIGRTKAEHFQFMGREYAKQIYRYVPEGADVFKRVGGVFWYTEYRNATSLIPLSDNGEIPGLGTLRRKLTDLFYFHERVRRGEYQLRPGQRDVYAELERAYQAIFPKRRFQGALPQTEVGQILDEPHFYLYDGQRQYELSEMSGGERAVFPLIFDFANWEIYNSVVLIDELELHLHPPMQQGLLRALRHLGKNNQFIITTHSDAVEALVSPEAIIRLENE
jgi:predicted ATPase